jgi:2-dehydropantoate 2-reductase
VKFVVLGAGGVGGVLGGRLAEAGAEVTLVARGDHLDALRREGLTLESPTGVARPQVEVAGHPADLSWSGDEVVLLTMKSQDTVAALDDLAAVAPAGTPVVCAQNGVANERSALRRFPDVYAICVMLPAAFVQPGVVQACSAPVSGLLDIGRYPEGVDDTAARVADALARATFVSEPRPDIMRWKHTKLLMNLGNAIEALCGRDARVGDLAKAARREGRACYAAAGIDAVTGDEDRERRGDLIRQQPIHGQQRGGGSTWQSLARGRPTVEADHLNGEIVLLGRLHGVPTPVNELLQREVNRAAREGAPPGSMTLAELETLLP